MGRKRPRIYQRIVLFQSVSIAVVIAVSGILSFNSSLAKEVRSMTSATDRIAERLTFSLSIPFWNLETKPAENLLVQEIQDPYLSGIVVLDKKGVWLGVAKTDDDHIIPIRNAEDIAVHLSKSPQRRAERITYTDPRGRTWEVGELVLYTTDKTIRNALAFLLRQTIIQALILSVTLSAFTVIVLNVLLNRPLRQITDTAQRIANGELELQAEVSGPREIATLATPLYQHDLAALREPGGAGILLLLDCPRLARPAPGNQRIRSHHLRRLRERARRGGKANPLRRP